MPALMRIQKSRMWRVTHREREVLGRYAAVATSRRLPPMRSLAMVRALPLCMSSDTAIWARTSAISRETHSLVSAAKANYSSLHSRTCCGVEGVTRVSPGEEVRSEWQKQEAHGVWLRLPLELGAPL